MRILHIVRDLKDARALAMAAAQASEYEVSLLLLHEAAGGTPTFPGAVYTCRDDALHLGREPGPGALDYRQIVDLLEAHDKVICW